MVDESDLLVLCAYEEARGEPDDGVAAVVQVILDRVRLHYACNGTITDAIERHAQFSWTEYDDVAGQYRRVAFNPGQELANIEHDLATAKADASQWARCARIATQVRAGGYRSALFTRLGSDAVLYYAPGVCAAPPWATPLAFIVQIGRQRFYRDISHGARPPPAAAAKPLSGAAAPAGGVNTVEVDL